MPSRLRAFLLILLLGLFAGPAAAHPGLWVVKDADTTIYLFGTVHLLPQDTDWHFPALDRALADSQTLYVEIVDDDQANMTALVLRYGMDMAHPLTGLLTSFDRSRLERAARLANVPGGVASLNMMRPWLAALTLTVAPLTQAGLDPAQGVDRQLRAAMQPYRAIQGTTAGAVVPARRPKSPAYATWNQIPVASPPTIASVRENRLRIAAPPARATARGMKPDARRACEIETAFAK